MRKSREETARTRKRIVAAASNAFRKNGVGATGLSDVMAAAGLTHGGFYKHFGSKDQLVAEACAAAADALTESLAAAAGGPGGAVALYLSAWHRDNPGDGCPLAALGGELGRGDGGTRAAAAAGFLRLVGVVAGQFGGLPPEAARRRALAAAATMIGAVTMARAVPDPALSAEILEAAAESIAAG